MSLIGKSANQGNVRKRPRRATQNRRCQLDSSPSYQHTRRAAKLVSECMRKSRGRQVACGSQFGQAARTDWIVDQFVAHSFERAQIKLFSPTPHAAAQQGKNAGYLFLELESRPIVGVCQKIDQSRGGSRALKVNAIAEDVPTRFPGRGPGDGQLDDYRPSDLSTIRIAMARAGGLRQKRTRSTREGT